MKKLNIALLAGGNSSEREVALASAAMILDAFDRSRYNVIPVDVHGLHWTCKGAGDRKVEVDKTDFSVPVGDGKIRFDYAFIMIHGTPGEDGKLQGYLEMMGIPYSTSGFVSSVETFDKTLCKRIVSEIDGLCLAREVLLRRGDRVDADAIAARLGLPVFVKPNASGSSCGVTKVKSVADMVPAIERAFTESDAVLIEEFIEGREFGCGVWITADGIRALPVTEIKSHKEFYKVGDKKVVMPVAEVIPKKEFFDYEAKYTAGMSDEITPAEIPAAATVRIQRLAEAAAKACNCRGIVRVDFIMTPTGDIYMVEINSVPGMSGGSIVPKQIAAAGLNMTEVINAVIEDTLCRR